MLQWIIYSFMLLTTIILMNMVHPLAKGLTLLIHTILICWTSWLMTKTFWFSYILFLIFFF